MVSSMLGQQLELPHACETKEAFRDQVSSPKGLFPILYVPGNACISGAMESQIPLKPESQGAVNQHMVCCELNPGPLHRLLMLLTA